MAVGTPVNVRSSSHDITEVEWVVELPGSNQATRVSDISHEESIVITRNCPEFTVVPIPRVRRSATNDQFWFEESSLRSQSVVVDQIRFTVDTVRERLEIYGRSCHLLFGGLDLASGHSAG